jgi:hypothetical protein
MVFCAHIFMLIFSDQIRQLVECRFDDFLPREERPSLEVVQFVLGGNFWHLGGFWRAFKGCKPSTTDQQASTPFY